MSGGGSKPGERRGGRQKGALNKATLERRAKAQAALLANTNAPIEQRELAKDALLRIAHVCEGAMAVCRPTTQAEIENGAKANPDGSWPRFIELGRLTGWCYKAAADFQSPKLLGVAVAPAPPVLDDRPREPRKLRIFEGGKLIELRPIGGRDDSAA